MIQNHTKQQVELSARSCINVLTHILICPLLTLEFQYNIA
jgi:hypothetical protein